MDVIPSEVNSRESHTAGYDLRQEFLDANIFLRILFVGYLLIGAFGGLVGGYLLLHETRHWVPWAIALTVIEPVGIACSVALLALVAPDWNFAVILRGAIRRATVGAAIVGFALFAFIVGTLAYVAWYFLFPAR